MDLSIIIISYNTEDILRDCLSSVITNTHDLDYEIIVIDNASSDGSVEMLRKEFPSVKIICNRENLGFAKANNQGIRIAKADNVLLLNSDTIVFDDCLSKISVFIKRRSDIGLLGCKVLNRDKTLQHSCYHTPNFLTELVFFTKGIIKDIWDPFTYFKYMKYYDHEQLKEVDCIAGCFLWVRKTVFDRVGCLDENFFMYYEDSEFCWRVRTNSKFKIYYFPESAIVHFGRMSADNLNYSTLKYLFKSGKYFLRKRYGNKTERNFDLLCKLIWKFEILFFSLVKFSRKFNKKILLLKEMLNL